MISSMPSKVKSSVSRMPLRLTQYRRSLLVSGSKKVLSQRASHRSLSSSGSDLAVFPAAVSCS
uniref:Uncharacterized protein n=1 Tax=uncultured marine virus TaxID=186617 RepID=A0A0F7L8I1_9VIRU|nr:hypothetical protein [uncultured marine virus]